jgi:hypothetical protein
VLDRLMRERDPVYAEADHAVETASEGPEAATWRIVALVRGAAAPEAALMSRDDSPASPARSASSWASAPTTSTSAAGLLDAAGEILARSSVCRASWS